MIIIEPFGGLANRIRVIASGLWLSNQTTQQLELLWNKNSELNCDFNKLFLPIDNLKISKKKVLYHYVKATNQSSIIKRITARLLNKFAGIDYCIKESDFSKFIWNNKLDILKITVKNKNVYFQTCEEFGDNINEFSKFVPTNEIQEIIYKQVQFFNKNTIGIHIRRSDHETSVINSPIELFVEKIKDELKDNNDANFFLATDDFETENTLKNLFGNAIITYKKELNRNLQKGIQDAVVDLFCLAKTKYIYGSYWSSFSDIAARIGGIKYITIKK